MPPPGSAWFLSGKPSSPARGRSRGATTSTRSGPVGRAQSMKRPNVPWQDALGQAVAVAPPLVPQRAEVSIGEFVAGKLIRQESAHAEHAGKYHDWLIRLAKFWQQFGQAPHGPTVLLVAQRGEQSLPERLPPVGPPLLSCQTTCSPTTENAGLVWCPCCCQPPDATAISTSHSTGAARST